MFKISMLLILTLSQIITVLSYSGPPLGPGDFIYNGPTLTQPMVISSSNGSLDLELVVNTYSFKNFISFTTRAYFYKGEAMIPGPTIKIKPGDKVNVKVTNQLTGTFPTMSGMNMNMMHGSNVTNLHTHGLHVDPNVDTVFVEINPGQSHTYNYEIPSDHAPGLHWYHSHKHGASALQVMGGLYGAIIVDPSDSLQMPTEFSSWTRVLLELSHFSTKSTNTNTDPFTVSTYSQLRTMVSDTMSPNFIFTDTIYQDIYFTNGQFQPNYSMTAGQSVIFDIVNSSGDHNLEIQVLSQVGKGTRCAMVLLAIDGVYLTTPRSINFLPMVPASRGSIAVTCSTQGTFYLQSYGDQSVNLVDNETRFTQNLLTLNVGPSTSNLQGSSPLNIALSKIKRPSYLTDLTTTNTPNVWEISVDQTNAGQNLAWIGMGKDCTITSFGRATDGQSNAGNNPNCNYLNFPGQLGTTGKYRHTGVMGSVEQLNIWGRGGSPHSIHIHVNHFQVISHKSDTGNDLYSGNWGVLGDWRDTMPALPGKVSVRYTLAHFTGEIVMHCHFLMHEDQGMMATFYSGGNFCNYPDTCLANTSTPATSTSTNVLTTSGESLSTRFILLLLFIVLL